MGSAFSKSQDLRTVAELQEGVLAGPEAVVAYPGAIVLEAEGYSHVAYSPTITYQGVDEAVVQGLLSNKDSTIGKLLGVTQRLAGGIFEATSDIAASMSAESTKSTEALLGAFGDIDFAPAMPAMPALPGLPAPAVAVPEKLSEKTLLVGLAVGVGLIIFLSRRR